MPIPKDRAAFRAALRENISEAQERIKTATELHRKGDVCVKVIDSRNRPVAGALVSTEQTAGDFRFGANAFLLGGNGSPELDKRWEDLFADAFDLAVVPFFWKDLEPERGRPRFSADSPARYRRPPPDAVIDFCQRHGIEPKAHALTYHQFNPEWMSHDIDECERMYESWFAAVGERYRTRIPSWDVVNEAISRYSWTSAAAPLPRDWVAWSFAAARRHFPGCRLILNDDTASWSNRGYHYFGRETHPFVLLIENMLLKGVPIDEIGLQFHLMDYQESETWKRASRHLDEERLLEPSELLRVLDHYARFGKPVHISEITVPCFGTTPDDEELQAEIAEMLYRTWFSHPSVASIVWWNVVDGHAHGKEGELRGGLVNKDLSTKAVYRTLKRLIRSEWRTTSSGTTDAAGSYITRAFHGTHHVRVTASGRTLESDTILRPGISSSVVITV